MRAAPVLAALFALAALLSRPLPAAAQSGSFPYRLSLVTDGSIVATGLALYGSSFYFQSIKAKPDQSKVDAAGVPFFDGLYSPRYSSLLDNTASVVLGAAALMPAVLVPGREAGELLSLGTMYVETLGLAWALDDSLKSLVTRYAPYAFTASGSDFATSVDINSSIPSKHATLAFASACFAGSVFDRLNPGSPWRPVVWASGLSLAAAISVLRVVSGDHFPSDVLAGAAFGAAIGCLVPLLHSLPAGGAGLAFSPSGLMLSLRLD